MIMKDVVACVLSLGVRLGGKVPLKGGKIRLTEELLDDRVLIEILAEENSNIIIEEIMTAEVTHQNNEDKAGHGLHLQITRADDNLLVLKKAANLNSKEKVDGIVMLSIGERRIWKRIVTHTQENKRNSL